MSLTVGIVGLPNAGKSTLFNALASRRLAETAPRPFTTINPNEAVVPVPDKYLQKLSDLIKPQKTVPAAVTFIDIAGLVKGAHKGEGLGNQFLGKIREVDAIVHVVRAFTNPLVTHSHPGHEPGTLAQMIGDIEIVNLELKLGGIEKKPAIYVLNVDEYELSEPTLQDKVNTIKEKFKDEAVCFSAKLEEEFIDLEEVEKLAYLKELEMKSTGLELLIQKAYQLLNLITFYTIKGGKEIHAWSLKKGNNVLEAAGEVHTDFANKFIKAEVILVSKLLEVASGPDEPLARRESWQKAKENGLIRLEGKDYVVQDRDVIEFKIGT